MLLRLRLHESDRERLGCPEWLDVDPESVTNREAVTIRNVLGYATPTLLRFALRVTPLLNGDGPVMVDDRPVYVTDPMAWTGLVWVALRRCGIDTSLETLEFAYEQVDVVFPQQAELVETPAKPGKAPARRRSTRSAKKS